MNALKLNYCSCGSIIFKNKCSNRACSNRKQKTWRIGKESYCFHTSITFIEAQKLINKNFEVIKYIKKMRFYA